jgi:hypothetical protein
MKATVVKKEKMGGLIRHGNVSVFKRRPRLLFLSLKKYRLEGITGKLRRERDVGKIQ